MHQDQHTILQSLVQHGYPGIDERSKVRHLLDGIKTNELDTAKGQIWASPALQNNFDDCVTLFQDFINIKQTEPHSPWQNAAELTIRELKKGAGRKAMKAGSPKKLWDHALQLESYIRSNTAISHPELDGQVPETIMSGQTADISPFAAFRWYAWIKYYDPVHGYPEHKEILGRWLGPAVDIGPAMTSKILKDNGQIIYTSTYRALTDDEIANPDEVKAHQAFNAAVSAKLVAAMSKHDLSPDDIDADTPTFVPYEDDETTPSQLPNIDDVTPEVADS